jgi:hypothetical protein
MRLLTAGVIALCLAFSASPLSAQRNNRPTGRGGGSSNAASEAPRPGDGLDLSRHGFARVAISPHRASTVVAITLLLPGGSSGEERSFAGSAWLLGETVRAALARRLAQSGVTVRVEVTRDYTLFQLLTPPGRWQSAYDTLLEEVFTSSLDTSEMDRIRDGQIELFRFEDGAPVRAFQAELYGLMVGVGSIWHRDPRGSLESMELIGATDLNELRSRIYRREQAIMTLVGGLDRTGGPTVYVGPRADNPASRRRGGAAWSSGRTQRVTEEVTNTSIGAAFPARRDASRTVLEFLADRLDEELNPVPPAVGHYGTHVRLEELPGGPALVVEAATIPEERMRWETRIGRALSGLEQAYRFPGDFEQDRQHFRNVTLVADAAPEAEGKRMAIDLLLEGRLRDLSAEIDALTAQQVLDAVESLGRPRILVFGPDLGGDGG